MAGESAKGTRVIALVGPAGAGKTSLAEAMLFAAGATDRLGSTANGSSIGDSSPESRQRGETPREQLLAIFDVFSDWFSQPDFEGCSFLTTMVEINDREHPVYQATIEYLANIRGYIEELAAAAGIGDIDSFARKWHILMKGSIMAAHEGDIAAAERAKEIGELLLKEQGI